jgi:hypothetical protein
VRSRHDRIGAGIGAFAADVEIADAIDAGAKTPRFGPAEQRRPPQRIIRSQRLGVDAAALGRADPGEVPVTPP